MIALTDRLAAPGSEPKWAGRLSTDDYTTVQEAAGLLGVHHATVRALIGRGKLSAIKANAQWAIPVRALTALARSGWSPWDRPRRSHCPRGHAMAGDNIRVRPLPNGGEQHVCRACDTMRKRRRGRTHSTILGLAPLRRITSNRRYSRVWLSCGHVVERVGRFDIRSRRIRCQECFTEEQSG